MFVYIVATVFDDLFDFACSMVDDSSSIQSTIVSELQHMLDSVNEYAKTYKFIRDKFKEGDQPTIRLRILRKRSSDGRRYNLPTSSKVAALIVGDFDAFDCDRDFIVEQRSGLLKRISVFEPAYFPL